MRTDEEFQRRRTRLSWDCRRGMKEVEILLNPFRETQFAALSRPEQETFLDLLDGDDADLFAWFTGDTRPAEPALSAMIECVLAHAAR